MREAIWNYVEDNLKGFELEGVEITDDDIDLIEEKINKCNMTLEAACDEYLQGIRDCLDEGLEDEEEEYYFGFKVTGYYTVKVNAKSYEEAEKMARNEICDVDFGYLEDIDSEIIN